MVPLLGAHAEGAEDYAVSRLHGLQAADHLAAFGLVERTAGNHQQVDVALLIVIAAGLGSEQNDPLDRHRRHEPGYRVANRKSISPRERCGFERLIEVRKWHGGAAAMGREA